MGIQRHRDKYGEKFFFIVLQKCALEPMWFINNFKEIAKDFLVFFLKSRSSSQFPASGYC